MHKFSSVINKVLKEERQERLVRQESVSKDELFASVVLDMITGRRKASTGKQVRPITEVERIHEQPENIVTEMSKLDLNDTEDEGVDEDQPDPTEGSKSASSMIQKDPFQDLESSEEAITFTDDFKDADSESQGGVHLEEEGAELQEVETEPEVVQEEVTPTPLWDLLREANGYMVGAEEITAEEAERMRRELAGETGPGGSEEDPGEGGDDQEDQEETTLERLDRIREEYRRKWGQRKKVKVKVTDEEEHSESESEEELTPSEIDRQIRQVRLGLIDPHLSTVFPLFRGEMTPLSSSYNISGLFLRAGYFFNVFD